VFLACETRIDNADIWGLTPEFAINRPIGRALKEAKMTVKDTMESKLREKFNPERLEVINESHLHAGHQEHFDGTGETHFRIRIISPRFSGMSRIARHRAINDLLAEELSGGVHALAVEPAAPGEQVRW
jgi:BolA protein